MDNYSCIKKDPFGQRFSMNEKIAYERGYRFNDGSVLSPSGNHLTLTTSTTGYLRFSIRTKCPATGKNRKRIVSVHRLVAYQKYGEAIYNKCVVRHKDGNKKNNDPSNIFLGSQKKNIMDMPKQARMRNAIHAATRLRKFTDATIQEIRKNHTSYKETMQKYGITSKGTLWEILNRDYVTEKAV